MASILVVEDDKKTNEAICEYLKSAGHKLISVYDGVSALQSFGECNIDLVVLDIMFFSVILEFFLRASAGLSVPFGISHTRLMFNTPSIRFSLHSLCTHRSDTFHLTAASCAVIYSNIFDLLLCPVYSIAA